MEFEGGNCIPELVANQFDIDGGVAVTTDSATAVGETSATLAGSLVVLEASSADVWFEYGVAGSGLSETVDAGSAGEGDSFSVDIGGLDSGTAYEFVAVASTGSETAQGSVSTFETDDESSFCFITTATANDTETLPSLRRFRDDSMNATPLGRGLVGLYYRISPPIARTLDRHPGSPEAGAVRSLVTSCAGLSSRQAETDSRGRSVATGAMLVLLYLIGLLVGAVGHASLRIREMLG
jgi:subtilisin